MIRERLTDAIAKALKSLGIETGEFVVEHPADLSHGDYSTNAAMVAAKATGSNSREWANKIVVELEKHKPDGVARIDIAGPGFINFHLSREFFAERVGEIVRVSSAYGKNDSLKGQKVMVEYTDPNPFKEFHIGHLMSNAIGESLSRLVEASSAETKRVCYQGDVGMHVAKALWGKMHKPNASWGEAYAIGAQEYDKRKEDIDSLNKKIYERSDKNINALYDEGKQATLAVFENLYAVLGTTFDHYFFETEAAPVGKKIVEDAVGKVFEESNDAVVFKGEKYGLHTRVFLNSQGIPTYEAKELALAKLKYDWFPYDTSIVVTGNEINEYFRVLLAAMREVFPELAAKTKHISHGMLRLPSGKMSSRKGNVITALSLIEEVKDRVREKMEEPDETIAEQVAIAAIKYSILKQAPGKDITFDFDKSLSFEGDSGPYLQYTAVRARSVLEKGKAEQVPTWESDSQVKGEVPEQVTETERLLYRFPEVVEEALTMYAPQQVVHYLTALAGSFNTFYAKEKIADAKDPRSPYKLALTRATATVLANGLWLLGIVVPTKM
ncbi:arginine--tRNA ligase [Candidatus Wolfebacteria bacterium]|nr:arginine--tRNA ligase [Candidatus Wolfebacteria bacterium]